MTDDKDKWLEDQLIKFEVPEKFRDPITRMVKMAWFFETNFGLDQETFKRMLETVTELAKGHNIAPENPGEVWVQAKPGVLVIRDVVRVKTDAYSGETGSMHNGKHGVITAIRYGDIHVLYDGVTGANTVRHSPHALEKRIR